MATSPTTRATLNDLMRVDGKAELINGRIVEYMASGQLPSKVAFRIAMRLEQYAEKNQNGDAYPDGIGYAVPELTSGRESFSPDASFFSGTLPANPMRFIQGPPTFAVEVRSENDYGDAAEEAIAAKRADYLEAGTLVVWDVDPLAKTVAVYRHDDPQQATKFGRGDVADAEPAVPGWTMNVDDIFGG